MTKLKEEAVSIRFLVHHKESRQYDPLFILITEFASRCNMQIRIKYKTDPLWYKLTFESQVGVTRR
jgi:hypothetical protein